MNIRNQNITLSPFTLNDYQIFIVTLVHDGYIYVMLLPLPRLLLKVLLQR